MKERISTPTLIAIVVTVVASFVVNKGLDVVFSSDVSHAQIKEDLGVEIKTVSANHNADIGTMNTRIGTVESRVSAVEATLSGQKDQLNRIENVLTQLNRKI